MKHNISGGRPVGSVQWSYEHPDLGDDPTPDIHAEADIRLAKKFAEWLMAEFFHPGWYVEASFADGIVKFNIPALMGETQWMTIRIRDLEEAGPNARKLIRKYAGELLERFNIPRNVKFDEADFAAALARNPLAYLGGNGSRMTVPE